MTKYCLAFILIAISLSAARSADSVVSYPLWDGKESVASYAQRVNLPATKTIDLGKGVTMELVLIPAGKFLMGTPEPEPPEVSRFESEILMWLGIALFNGFLSMLVVRKLQGKKVGFSLRYLLLMTIFAGMAAGGYARVRFAEQEKARFDDERKRYMIARHNDEFSTRTVTLVEPFYMGKYAVTQSQYEAVTGESPSKFAGASLPVSMVSFGDAKAFCKKLYYNWPSAQTVVQLPTEAQWEFACRAGTQTPYYSNGNDVANVDEVAWYFTNSMNKTHPVGMKKPNNFGLYDMLGNVSQWCDVAGANEGDGDINPSTQNTRAIRGGNFSADGYFCRVTSRTELIRSCSLEVVGFRLIAPLPKNSNQ